MLTSVLRDVATELQRVSGADIVSVTLYDEAAKRFYAPFALGQPEESLLDGLADQNDQLERYSADAATGKVPDDLSFQQYGSTVWLTVNRRPLLAPHAPAELASTYVRRFRIRGTIGLPLQAADRLVGLVYLNYTEEGQTARWPDASKLTELEREAAKATATVQAELAALERKALEGVGRLTGILTAPPAGESPLRRTLSIVLADLLFAADLDAAAIYEFAPGRETLHLVTAHAPAEAPVTVTREGKTGWEEALRGAMASAFAAARLHPVVILPLGEGREHAGFVAICSRDPLASVRRAPASDVLLRSGAQLIAGALSAQRLISELQRGGGLLRALAGMTNAMIRPGSTRRNVIEAVSAHLTDAEVPEFDFHFATVNLLRTLPDGTSVVWLASGASTSESIDAAAVAADGESPTPPARVPRWALEQERALAANDVLVAVAHRRQVVVVGGTGGSEELVAGPIPERASWEKVPVVGADGVTTAEVPVLLVGEPAAPVEPGPPFTLDRDIFEKSGHGSLLRLFLPLGFEGEGPASGVLEVGYHRSSGRRSDWGQIQALRSAAAQVSVAVETARLYEEARDHAEQLELSADVSRAIASSIDLEQTLRLVAGNLARLVGASLCQIALYEEDGQGWYGAAASDQEEEWRHRRGERPQPSLFFDLQDRREPIAVEDVARVPLVDGEYAQAFRIRSILALPLIADGEPIGAAVLAQRDRMRIFTADEQRLAEGIANQAAVAIKNARLHALVEEERHIQKDFILVGLGMWGQKAYQHLQTLKNFFNFRVHVVEKDLPGARERLADKEQAVRANGDEFYWDSPAMSAIQQLRAALEPSCYVITYVATPAATHLETLDTYYDLSDVVLVEKPLGSPPEEYRAFLDQHAGRTEIVAADHYYFKLEVRLLQQMMAEERTLRDFLDSVNEIVIEIVEAQPLKGAAADIGVVSDLVPHAFAIASLFSPIDRIELDADAPMRIGRHAGFQGSRESYARLGAWFPYRGRRVRLVIEVGKGVEDAKWIKLYGESRLGGRSPFYKFDFGKGEAIDGTQSTVRAAVRIIREPGVPDNAHLTMLRHVIEKRRPAVGILAIREAIRANQRIRQLEAMAGALLEAGSVVTYELGARPEFEDAPLLAHEPPNSGPNNVAAVPKVAGGQLRPTSTQ